MKSDLNGEEILEFQSPEPWRKWLEKNSQKNGGVWLRMYKKATNIPTITYAEALDEALCFGWIDSQKNSFDVKSWIQRFSPRRPKGPWSQRNVEHIERLTKLGKMRAQGIKEVEAAKADGRWQAAYSSPSQSTMPEDFLKELEKRPKAKAFFETLNKSNLYAIYFRLQSAKKEETRQRRLTAIIEMLENGEKFY